jgi:mono/diheme cytochrome c family protein
MRYFFLILFLLSAAILSIAGLRYDHGGHFSRKPPIEIFPDMDRQPKLRPQTLSKFSGFADGLSSRLPVAGTIARGSAYEDNETNTGKKSDGSFVEVNPVAINAEIVKRGHDRFNIYCTPCHGPAGDGNGVTKRFGMTTTASLLQDRLILAPDGQLFDTITNGKTTMMPYASQIPIQDRWAIVAYVRALQLSRVGTKDDVPADKLSQLK